MRLIDKVNRFSRRVLSEEEVYIFSVVLCDNEIDRDCERFSDDALQKLSSLFIGKTGIFDHDPRSAHQSARIFDTELVTDASRTTKNGEPYRFLKAQVYMVRTDENKGLIAEIDGGIKKEVSISCAASERICSVCGSDKAKLSCEHVKGKIYNGKLCHTVLSGISDAYEWSFISVPIRANAICDRPVEVKPVRHGRWYEGGGALLPMHKYDEYTNPEAIFFATCSECRVTINCDGVVGGYSYCPSCGAKMDGESFE